MATGRFDRYAARIARLPQRRLTAADLLIDTFLLQREGDLSIYYIPFERVNHDARVVLIGITPGFTQMRLAYEAARNGLKQGLAHDEVLARVGQKAAFAGQMRTNLSRMLDELGLPGLLGIDCTEQLFSDRADLLHSTSALHNPVFVRGRNYTGSAPQIATSQILDRQVLHTLEPELASVPSAILVPLGRAVQDALGILIGKGLIDPERCCLGFPHPSGANAQRARLFAQECDTLGQTLVNWFTPGAHGASQPTGTPRVRTVVPHRRAREMQAPSYVDGLRESIDARIRVLSDQIARLDAARAALNAEGHTATSKA